MHKSVHTYNAANVRTWTQFWAPIHICIHMWMHVYVYMCKCRGIERGVQTYAHAYVYTSDKLRFPPPHFGVGTLVLCYNFNAFWRTQRCLRVGWFKRHCNYHIKWALRPHITYIYCIVCMDGFVHIHSNVFYVYLYNIYVHIYIYI